MNPHERLHKLLGRQPDALEVRRLEHLRSLFELRNDDSLWSLFLLFEYLQNKRRPAALGLQPVGLAVVFGASCLALGAALQASGPPNWSQGTDGLGVMSLLLQAFLYAPAGWMLPLLVAPTCLQRLTTAFAQIRAEGTSPARRRSSLALSLGITGSYLAWTLLLWRLAPA